MAQIPKLPFKSKASLRVLALGFTIEDQQLIAIRLMFDDLGVSPPTGLSFPVQKIAFQMIFVLRPVACLVPGHEQPQRTASLGSEDPGVDRGVHDAEHLDKVFTRIDCALGEAIGR